MIINSSYSLAEIVRQNHLTAQVLEKYKLDFCCKGKVSLTDACVDNNLDELEVLTALQQAIDNSHETSAATAVMPVDELIDYIIRKHHRYVMQQGFQIQMHLTKVATKHGERFPNMVKVWELFMPAFDALKYHLQQEEQVLFPRIKEVFEVRRRHLTKHFTDKYLEVPINAMEGEHDVAGESFQQIRQLTNDYAIPDGACNTFRLLLTELQDFEADLHRHVHLENHVLFPAALQLIAAT